VVFPLEFPVFLAGNRDWDAYFYCALVGGNDLQMQWSVISEQWSALGYQLPDSSHQLALEAGIASGCWHSLQLAFSPQ
jgi:hypothetical protein